MKIIFLSLLFLFMYPNKRHIILFYNSNGITIKDTQLVVLNGDKKGLEERNISIQVYKTDEEKATAQKWKIQPDHAFTFILVGKDGSEKMRVDTVVSLAQLYKTIDAMPMRREEMKKNN